MYPLIIELQDRHLALRNREGLLKRSPGVISVASGQPVFGDDALAQSHLHPQLSYNHFWTQLGMDPLPVKNKHFRHTADMAYAHLQSLVHEHKPVDGAVIAVPPSYTRAQLAILLGLIKQCDFAAVGLVDHALLLAAAGSEADTIVIDLQLHQAVLSRHVRMDGHLVRDRVVQVPFAGLLALRDAWLNLIAGEFVRQSRFDPQRNAEAEQYLADQLPRWLAAIAQSQDLMLEINLKGTVHQAMVTREQFEQRSQPVFARINAELAQLRHPESVLHIATSQVGLPGLTRAIPGLVALDDELVAESCYLYLDAIRRPADGLQFISKLPVTNTPAKVTTALQAKTPTHVLVQHKAHALPPGRLGIGKLPAGVECARLLPVGSAADGFSLLRTPRGVQLELHNAATVWCNGKPAVDGQFLVAGDSVQFAAAVELQLIIVEAA
ncbi:MAG TPA: hypothetical protein VMH83_07155 [Candidatus Acidoferrum sp.]|nr:hypothetical protein [Candidatus Acidoferrum sp.]